MITPKEALKVDGKWVKEFTDFFIEMIDRGLKEYYSLESPSVHFYLDYSFHKKFGRYILKKEYPLLLDIKAAYETYGWTVTQVDRVEDSDYKLSNNHLLGTRWNLFAGESNEDRQETN